MWRYTLAVLLLIILQIGGLAAVGAATEEAPDFSFPGALRTALNGILVCAPAMLLLMLRGARTGAVLLLCGVATLLFAVFPAFYPDVPFAASRYMALAASVAYFVALGAYQLRRIPRFA